MKQVFNSEGPSSQYSRTLVANTIKGMVFETRVLRLPLSLGWLTSPVSPLRAWREATQSRVKGRLPVWQKVVNPQPPTTRSKGMKVTLEAPPRENQAGRSQSSRLRTPRASSGTCPTRERKPLATDSPKGFS